MDYTYTLFFAAVLIGCAFSSDSISFGLPLRNYIKNTFSTEKASDAIELGKIASQILNNELFFSNENVDDEIRQLGQCQKIGAAFVWKIQWELELIKMVNSLDIHGKHNPKNYEQIEDLIKKNFSEIQNAKKLKHCQNGLNVIYQKLEVLLNDDLGHLPQIRNTIEMLHAFILVKNRNWQHQNVQQFMMEFIGKNKYELELAKEFKFEFLKMLETERPKVEKNFHLASNEFAQTIFKVQKLIEKLNEQKNATVMKQVTKLLAAEISNKLKSKFEEWAKFEEAKTLAGGQRQIWNYEKKKLEREKLDLEKIGKKIGSLYWEAGKLIRYLNKWKNEKEDGFYKEIYKKTIDESLTKINVWFNFVKWSVKIKEIMPGREDEDEAKQLMINLALFRRFLLQNQNNGISLESEIKANFLTEEAERHGHALNQQNIFMHNLEQKIKWILRKRQRIEEQFHGESTTSAAAILQLKLEQILQQICDEFARKMSKLKELLKRPLRKFYYGNEEGKTLKIRISGVHAYVTLGEEYEYDYLAPPNPPRRIIFKKSKDAELEENNSRKAQPIEGLTKFSVAEADAVFIEMLSKGWIPSNYSQANMRHCGPYVYEFVCQLNGNKCPAKEQWPEPYRYVDNRAATQKLCQSFGEPSYQNISVYSKEYANSYHLQFNSKNRGREEFEGGEECAIKEVEIQIKMIKGEEWRKMEQQKKMMNEEEENDENASITMQHPAIVDYDIGHFDQFQFDTGMLNCPFEFKQPLNMQEYLVKEEENEEEILYSALLKVNVCKLNGVHRAFVNNLHLFDVDMKNVVQAFGGVDLYEENRPGQRLFSFEFGIEKNKQAEFSQLCQYR